MLRLKQSKVLFRHYFLIIIYSKNPNKLMELNHLVPIIIHPKPKIQEIQNHSSIIWIHIHQQHSSKMKFTSILFSI